MPQYVDGWVIPIAKSKVAGYLKIAKKASTIWRDHGALEYRECIGDDLKVKGLPSFTAFTRCKAGETLIFAWVVYKSRAHRDKVNAAVMKDPGMKPPSKAEQKNMPFDMKRMSYGGFKTIVALSS